MRSKLLGEEIMDKSLEPQVTQRVRMVRPRWIPGLSRDLLSDNLYLQHAGNDFALCSDTQLPPTRAVRTPRSRGVFSRTTEPPKKQSAWRKADMSIVGLAVAVVAIAAALIVGAPSAIMGAAVNLNPGPAIVGAASVPPAFIEPSRTR
jgi:hypothetical protein